mmetsp:Transcript_16268/g.28164  ORF Transcript_16268/g.28164 Transcript_16268/m.28164 type:complete len:89 (+) Transcript_16268:321-587(+)
MYSSGCAATLKSAGEMILLCGSAESQERAGEASCGGVADRNFELLELPRCNGESERDGVLLCTGDRSGDEELSRHGRGDGVAGSFMSV